MIKFVSNGLLPKIIPELAGFEYKYFSFVWMPVENDRMAAVIAGTNNEFASNDSPVFEADLIPYTGEITDVYEGDNGSYSWRTVTTSYYELGYLHNDNGPAWIRSDSINGGEPKVTQGNAYFGLYENSSNEQWALDVYKNFGGEDQ